jgi:uncharacterized protein with von Willebrand factor type A (vWA) domain
MTKRPEHVVADAVVALGRGLRELGVRTTVDSELALCRALGEVDLRRRQRVYWAGRCTLVHHRDDVPTYDAVFERFWAGRPPTPGETVAEHAESDPRMPGPQHGGESLPQFRTEGRSSQLVDGERTHASREIPSAGSDDASRRDRREARGVLAAYSPSEVLDDPEPLRYADQELLAVRRLADELRRAVPERRSRRLRPTARRGRLDVRATVRGALRTDGEPLRPAFSDRSRRPRRLLVICDVSGSMERYSRALLGALEAVVGSGLRAETFVFATRLTRLTGPLRGHDAARALAEARAAVPDWSGGTRIGPALAEFNAVYGRRGFARGAVAIVVSDGWDRGDPRLLARELDRLRLQCRRLIWINPRPNEIAGQPFAIGMRAALPYVDDYLAGMDPRAMLELGRVIAGLDGGRPSRRQRPVGSRP